MYFNKNDWNIPQFKVGDKILIYRRHNWVGVRRKFIIIGGPFAIKSLVGGQALEVHWDELADNNKQNM